MKRFWIGAVLLLVLLGVGLWVMHTMSQVHQPIVQALEAAAQAGLSGDLEAGRSLAGQAKGKWQQHWKGIASATDHAPLDEIDSLFAQAEAYAAAGQTWNFSACCAKLSQLVEAVQESGRLTWWNLL